MESFCNKIVLLDSDKLSKVLNIIRENQPEAILNDGPYKWTFDSWILNSNCVAKIESLWKEPENSKNESKTDENIEMKPDVKKTKIDDKHKTIHECQHCRKKIKNYRDYKLHVQAHLGIRSYPCPECEMAFTHPSNLRVHARIHNPDQVSFSCTVENCGKTFRHSQSLKDHLETHDSSIRIVCPVCEKTFATRKYLAKHIKAQHGDKPKNTT